MRILSFIILAVSVLSIASCKSKRDQTIILHYSENGTEAEWVKELSNKDWRVTKSNSPELLNEDSLLRVSAVVINISELNRLDHRAIPQLKRYLESGGGGIVAVRDTVYTGRGWPWMDAWLKKEAGAMFSQDQGRLAVVARDPSPGDMVEVIEYAVGKNQVPDYGKARTLAVPDSSRYVREVLTESLDEPLQMAILPNKDVLFIERKGGVKLYEDSSGLTKTVANLHVFSGIEDGLLGVATDPDFENNHWVYFYFAVGGEKAVNHLARFELHGDSLALASQKVLLEIQTQRVYCCHSAGYLAFDKEGLLYLSTGDNTNAEETEGYTPVDERPGRSLSDDQATAANTNDLRGKILRIKPSTNGSYKIPEGNLFPKDGSKGRPEIYVMGTRNPFRFSLDNKTGNLYFGDVGPDTKVKASTGELMSFDEINQVRKPGFYGWPYFLGNNEVFPMYNYATKELEPGKDPLEPINDSPNNTGLRELPPAQPAMIWYGKGNSAQFPLVGNGGASVMAGPVFNSLDFQNTPYKLSDYYDGKLLIYEWIRGWVLAVTLDEKGDYLRMEPFLEHLKFDAPVDVQFAADGSIYVLEYGTNWFSKNTNARIVRIRYKEGNRDPNAVIEMDKQYGGAPMEVTFSGAKSSDFDQEDKLSFSWEIGGQQLKGESLSYTFREPGTYEVVLSVEDDKGGLGQTKAKVFVGNTPPSVSILSKANRSFYWDNAEFDYDIRVEDKEEEIEPERVNISFGFIPHGKDAATILTGNQQVSSFKYIKGKQMIAALDCRSCHSLDQESVGPTYQAVADRYAGKKNSLKMLSDKIIAGGSGNWGERAMSPHPEISEKEAQEMVSYILSLAEKGSSRLPTKGKVKLQEHIGKGNEGVYLLNATYKDRGANGIGELQSRDYILLKNPVVQAEDFDSGNVRVGTITTEFLSYVRNIIQGKYIRFDGIDLSYVRRMVYRVQANGVGGRIEMRLGKIDGPVVSTIEVPGATNIPSDGGWKELNSALKETTGRHDVYFVFAGEDGNQNYFNLDWIRFSNR